MRELHRRDGIGQEEQERVGGGRARPRHREGRALLVALAASGILMASACTDTMDRWKGFRAAEGGEAGQAGRGGASASTGGSATGGVLLGGAGGLTTGGARAGGATSGGIEVGGGPTGGVATGGERPGGVPSGGQSGAGGSSGDDGGTGGALVFPILERAVLRDTSSGAVSECTTFVYRGHCQEDPQCFGYDALGLSLPQHDVLELYVRVGPTHLSSEHCWVYDWAPNVGLPGWKEVDGGCTEYVTEAGDLGTLVRQEHAVDATFSAQHDKDVSGPAQFLAFSHFEDGAHQYIWVYSAAAP